MPTHNNDDEPGERQPSQQQQQRQQHHRLPTNDTLLSDDYTVRSSRVDDGEGSTLRDTPSPSSSSCTSSSLSGGEEEEEEEEEEDEAPTPPPPRTMKAKPPPTYASFLAAVLRGWLVIAMSFGINILNLIVYLTIRPWSRVTARRLTGEWWQRMWVSVMAYLLPKSEIVLTGDALHKTIDTSRPAIIIANHQVDADWWYCWEFARAYGLAGRLKIILKAELRKIPVVGWGMRQFEFLFLDRSWQHDQRRVYKLLGSFVEDGYECAMLVFPEGTTINTSALEKSRAFALDQGRPHMQHLVLPRTRAFQACMDALSQMPGITPIIYDLTLAYHGYSGEVPTWEMGYGREHDVDTPNVEDMLRGRACPRVHVHVKVYEGDEAVRTDVEGWLDARWKEKDVLLERFIHEQCFDERGRIVQPEGSLAALLFLLVLPLIIALLLPAILLLTLIAWPLILLAGTLQFLNLIGRSAMGVVKRNAYPAGGHRHKVKRNLSRRSMMAAPAAGAGGVPPRPPAVLAETTYSRFMNDDKQRVYTAAQLREEKSATQRD